MNSYLKKMFKIGLMLTIFILSTVFFYKVQAGIIYYDDVINPSGNYLCSERGIHLASKKNTNTIFEVLPKSFGDNGTEARDIVKYFVNAWDLTSRDYNGQGSISDRVDLGTFLQYLANFGFDTVEFKYEDATNYGVVGGIAISSRAKNSNGGFANAVETYILAHGANYANTKWQEAWWCTPAGGGNGGSAEGYLEALAFANYISRVSTSSICSKDGFNIKYEPKWVTGGNYDNPTVRVMSNGNYVIGPFAIDYVSESYGNQFFAGIKEMKISTDVEKDLVLGTDWFIIDSNTNKRYEKGKYPGEKSEFYIELANYQNATKLTDIDVEFSYMNGSAQYQLLDGEYKTLVGEMTPSLIRLRVDSERRR